MGCFFLLPILAVFAFEENVGGFLSRQSVNEPLGPNKSQRNLVGVPQENKNDGPETPPPHVWAKVRGGRLEPCEPIAIYRPQGASASGEGPLESDTKPDHIHVIESVTIDGRTGRPSQRTIRSPREKPSEAIKRKWAIGRTGGSSQRKAEEGLSPLNKLVVAWWSLWNGN